MRKIPSTISEELRQEKAADRRADRVADLRELRHQEMQELKHLELQEFKRQELQEKAKDRQRERRLDRQREALREGRSKKPSPLVRELVLLWMKQNPRADMPFDMDLI